MVQHRRAISSGQDSAVHLYLKNNGQSFEDTNVHIRDKEDGWFERGVKEAIYVKMERTSLNGKGGRRHQLSSTDNAALTSLPSCHTLKLVITTVQMNMKEVINESHLKMTHL